MGIMSRVWEWIKHWLKSSDMYGRKGVALSGFPNWVYIAVAVLALFTFILHAKYTVVP